MKLKDPKNPSGPVKIGKYKVWIERDLCIGAATCLAIAPRAYKLDKDAKAIFLDSCDNESIETIVDSARGCPTAAIIIEDENDKRIYPK
ncbi:hypothetical protein A2690_03775 [Candidatus Roizmanbacteria bacterium RIFCSPHIGHO2_01_FULL_39_12b]|uniref:Ferredoxin n=1 Tax=Candidatus Roizmanbacteria bacterium RIFCSPHIGHO2_01_FULL_39_12b TaxID=1802030 RepID=A0A1F7GBX4_9BACT|nr:MAG: hypothetical protein A2690_03775 [Candidatus Roizmanbacteria bacterium RIFCSPHIGHO2_01_FULL_39_12b]OGK47060.1 MAG: hypothetical protein A3B46_01500 [Candidatus Roizmanbacteria bacterium RIFCSPLOWO2_01_FULL_39_19]